MTSQPEWSPVDDDTGSLLHLVALGSSTGTADREWLAFLGLLSEAADADGVISPNALRALTRDVIAPQRCGAFTRRALLRGHVVYSGQYETSDDTGSRNRGKPCRVMRLTNQPRG